MFHEININGDTRNTYKILFDKPKGRGYLTDQCVDGRILEYEICCHISVDEQMDLQFHRTLLTV